MMVLWIILQRCTFLHVHVVWNYTHAFSMQQCINSFAHLLGFSIILSCNTCIHVEPVHIITCSFLNTVNQPTFICMQDTYKVRESIITKKFQLRTSPQISSAYYFSDNPHLDRKKSRSKPVYLS